MPFTPGRPRLYFERHGAGQPLLLINGFTLSCTVFEPVLPLYTGALEVVMYDSRGSGRSGAPAWPTSMPELAADATRLLDHLEIESAHVYGISMGGMVAQELALRFPERVRGLILGATSPGGPLAHRPAARQLSRLGSDVVRAGREDGRPWLAGMLFSPAFRREQPERTRELLRHFDRHRAPARGVASHFWASVYHDTVARLPSIQAPTLVLHGAGDAMDPIANAELLADRIPDAELAVVPGAGHAYPLERPEESARLVLDWLERRGPIPPGRPRTGWAARAEPVTRPFGLPIGALRTGVSLGSRLAGRPAPRRAPGTPSG